LKEPLQHLLQRAKQLPQPRDATHHPGGPPRNDDHRFSGWHNREESGRPEPKPQPAQRTDYSHWDQQRWDGAGQEWWNAHTNEWNESAYDRAPGDKVNAERWEAGGYATDWKGQTPNHKRGDWEDWNAESPFDTAPARMSHGHHGDRFADPSSMKDTSNEWGGWDDRWNQGSANGFDGRRRREDRLRRGEPRPDRAPRTPLDPLAVASVLPAPVLPKPVAPAPAPEPPAPRTNIKFAYTITKGASVPESVPAPEVKDTSSSDRASERDASERAPSENAPEKTSRVGSESENDL
jgi:hypothetical protein